MYTQTHNLINLLFITPPPWSRRATMAWKKTRREEQGKNGSGWKGKPSPTTQTVDAHIGEEEKNKNLKEEQKKEREGGRE